MIDFDDVNDFPGMSREDLLKRKLEVEEQIQSIKAQIQAAKHKVKEFGEYSDRDWYQKVNGARRVYGRFLQAIQNELARRRDSGENDFETRRVKTLQAFINIAENRLDEGLFESLLEDARAHVKGMGF